MYYSPEDSQGPVATLLTQTPRDIRFEGIEDADVGPDEKAVAFFNDEGRRVSRAIIPANVFDKLPLFLAQPVPLLLAMEEVPPGLAGNLLALIPASAMRASRLEDEPWLASLPVDESEAQYQPLFIGKVVRFEKDRRWPDDLVKDATDVFERLLAGDSMPVVDKMLESL